MDVAKLLSKNKSVGTPAITDSGRQQAVEAAKNLSRFMDVPNVVFVSPHLPTVQTFELLKEGWPELRNVHAIIDDRIREQDFGLRLLYGDWRVLQVFHPEQRPLYSLQGPYWYRHPQGENIADVRTRLRQWATTLSRDYSGKNVLAITHHISILAFKSNIERLDPEAYISLYNSGAPRNCGITQYANKRSSNGAEWLELLHYDKSVT